MNSKDQSNYTDALLISTAAVRTLFFGNDNQFLIQIFFLFTSRKHTVCALIRGANEYPQNMFLLEK